MLGKLGGLFKQHSVRPHKLFQIEPSLACNLECVMCPWTELHSDLGQMSWDTFTRIVPYLPLTEGVDFTGGGEPTLNPHLFDMVRAAKEAGCEVGFSTNATLLETVLAEKLVSLNQDWISFSVDAALPKTYERIRQGSRFDTVYKNISTLRNIKSARGSQTPKMMLVFVMMQENFRELPAYVDLAHEWGIEQIIFKNLDVILKDDGNDRRLFNHNGPPPAKVEPFITTAQKRAKKLGVGLRLYALQPQELAICEINPLQNLFFSWTGDVSPCITLAYADNRIFNGERHVVSCQRYGNINSESLEDIWHKPAYQAFRQAYENRVRLERQITINALVGETSEETLERPPAPEGCRTCYYLYGV
jgi:MoaA/NifB/PqqE/SkfB family radical SAM enzyme